VDSGALTSKIRNGTYGGAIGQVKGMEQQIGLTHVMTPQRMKVILVLI